ncbi:MAG TPA: hypothetical protein VFA74_09190 [Terriglobales bacterium]|nr:hypothetical protein [Terriglobales bacterium]
MNLFDFADKHRLKTRRDPADDTTIIPGKKVKSHIFEYSTALLGVCVQPESTSANWWNLARKAFLTAGMVVTQNGDREGIATFSSESEPQVKAALKFARIRPKRVVTPEQRAALLVRLVTRPKILEVQPL